MKMIKYKNEIRGVEFRIDQRGYKTSEIIGIIRHYSPISDRLIFLIMDRYWSVKHPSWIFNRVMKANHIFNF